MKSPAFQFYVQDFLIGVRHFTTEEVGAYLLLLCEQWDKGFVENDPILLRKISGISVKKLQKVLEKFEKGESGLYNKRLETERNKKIQYSGQQSDRAKKRWKNNDANADANALPTHMPPQCSSSSTSSSTSKEEAAAPNPMQADTIAMQLMGYRQDLSKEQAIDEAKKMLQKTKRPGSTYISEWANRIVIQDRRVKMQSPFGDIVYWEIEKYNRLKETTNFKFLGYED